MWPAHKMTDTRQLVLDFIKAYIDLHGASPSLQCITNALGLVARSNTHRIVHWLQDEGYLTTLPRKACSIRLTKAKKAPVKAAHVAAHPG